VPCLARTSGASWSCPKWPDPVKGCRKDDEKTRTRPVSGLKWVRQPIGLPRTGPCGYLRTKALVQAKATGRQCRVNEVNLIPGAPRQLMTRERLLRGKNSNVLWSISFRQYNNSPSIWTFRSFDGERASLSRTLQLNRFILLAIKSRAVSTWFSDMSTASMSRRVRVLPRWTNPSAGCSARCFT